MTDCASDIAGIYADQYRRDHDITSRVRVVLRVAVTLDAFSASEAETAAMDALQLGALPRYPRQGEAPDLEIEAVVASEIVDE